MSFEPIENYRVIGNMLSIALVGVAELTDYMPIGTDREQPNEIIRTLAEEVQRWISLGWFRCRIVQS